MKASAAVFNALVAGVFAFSAPGAIAAPVPAADAHGHQGAAISALELNAGRKWQTDAPLRKGMEQIRSALAAEKSAIHAGKITPAR